MPSHSNRSSRQQQKHTRHHQLYEADPEIKRGAERRRERVGKEAKVNFLRKQYREKFDLAETDLLFVRCLAHLEVNGKVYIKGTDGEPITRQHYLSEGHRWVVEEFDPDLKRLQELDLIQKPRIDGEERERIIRRRFWDLTSSGRDLADIQYSGENIGDPGEHVVHKLGHHLLRWWTEEKWGDMRQREMESYPTVDGAELDFVVWNVGGYQEVDGEDVDKFARHVYEIETGTSDVTGIESDAHKLAHFSGESWWVCPTRDVLVGVLEELTMRGYTDLSMPIPQTLALRNHRDTYNERLEGVVPESSSLHHSAVDHVMTYSMMVDKLKQWRPELFYGPKDTR